MRSGAMTMKTCLLFGALALMLSGCPDDLPEGESRNGEDDTGQSTGIDASSDVDTTTDTGGTDSTEPMGCVSNTECSNFGAPGPCQQAVCDNRDWLQMSVSSSAQLQIWHRPGPQQLSVASHLSPAKLDHFQEARPSWRSLQSRARDSV